MNDFYHVLKLNAFLIKNGEKTWITHKSIGISERMKSQTNEMVGIVYWVED